MSERNKFQNLSDKELVEEYIFRRVSSHHDEELLVEELKRRQDHLIDYAEILCEFLTEQFNKIWRNSIFAKKRNEQKERRKQIVKEEK